MTKKIALPMAVATMAAIAICAWTGRHYFSSPNMAPSTPFRSAILITIDTLRGDHLGFAGNPDIRSPSLDRLSKRSMVFPDACTNLPITLPAHSAMMTSRFPMETGVLTNIVPLPDTFPTLAETLKTHGFSTAAFPQAILQFPRGLERGFDLYYGMASRKSDSGALRTDQLLQFHHPTHHLADNQTSVPKAVRWIADRNQVSERYFLWMHFFEPHLPYNPPAPYRYIDQAVPHDAVEISISEFSSKNKIAESRFSSDDIAIARTLYRDEILWVDTKLDALFRECLHVEGDVPFVIVTSDHGETLHDRYPYFNHGYGVNLEEVHIPFFVYSGGRMEGIAADRIVQSVDVAPTVLAALGIESLPDYRGINILEQQNPDQRKIPFSLETPSGRFAGAMDRHYKVVRDGRTGEWSYWNRTDDPDERSAFSITSSTPEFIRNLQTTAAAYSSIHPITSGSAVQSEELDPDFRQMLETLGYLQ